MIFERCTFKALKLFPLSLVFCLFGFFLEYFSVCALSVVKHSMHLCHKYHKQYPFANFSLSLSLSLSLSPLPVSCIVRVCVCVYLRFFFFCMYNSTSDNDLMHEFKLHR